MDNLTSFLLTSSNFSLGEERDDDEDELMRLEVYITPVLFGLIFLVGSIGNGTLIYIILNNKNMRSIPNIYIMNLSIGDLMLIIICIPFTATIYVFDSWPYGETICKVTEFLQSTSVGVSIFTLIALSADRFFAIVLSMRRLTGNTSKYTIFVVILIWIAALLLSIPDANFSLVQEISGKNNTTILFCYPYPVELGEVNKKVRIMSKFFIYYAIPLTIITIFYSLMAKNLLFSSKNMPGESKGQIKQIEARKKVAKMVLSIVIIFMLCFLPKNIYMLWFHFYSKAEDNYNYGWHVFRITGFCLAFINSCINPIALYFLSKVYRRYYNKYLFCCCYRPHTQLEPTSSMAYFNSTVRRTSTTVTMVHSASL